METRRNKLAPGTGKGCFYATTGNPGEVADSQRVRGVISM